MNTIKQIIHYNQTDFPLSIPLEYCLGPGDKIAFKFILTSDGTLIIGPLRHGLLAALYFGDSFLASNVRQSLKHAEETLGENVLSAGAIAPNGNISWGSTGFDITSPPRDPLLAAEIMNKINETMKRS